MKQYGESAYKFMNMLYEKIVDITSKAKENLIGEQSGGLEYAIVGVPNNNIKSEEAGYSVKDLLAPAYFARGNGKGHTGMAKRSGFVHVPKKGSVDIHSYQRKDGESAKECIMRVLGLNDKQARKALKAYGQR